MHKQPTKEKWMYVDTSRVPLRQACRLMVVPRDPTLGRARAALSSSRTRRIASAWIPPLAINVPHCRTGRASSRSPPSCFFHGMTRCSKSGAHGFWNRRIFGRCLHQTAYLNGRDSLPSRQTRAAAGWVTWWRKKWAQWTASKGREGTRIRRAQARY